ncbi:MAG: hypothetical protein ACYTG6_00055 [Planctomycetota bacterium]
MAARRATVIRIALVLFVFLALAVAASLRSCEEEGVDRSNFLTVFHRAMAATADKDLDALWPLLTPDGQIRVEKNLIDWQNGLQDPARFEEILRRIRAYYGEVSEAEIALARDGTLKDVWRFYLTVDPRPADPRMGRIELAEDERHARVFYEDPRGTLRVVRFVLRRGGWYIDDFQL